MTETARYAVRLAALNEALTDAQAICEARSRAVRQLDDGPAYDRAAVVRACALADAAEAMRGALAAFVSAEKEA